MGSVQVSMRVNVYAFIAYSRFSFHLINNGRVLNLIFFGSSVFIRVIIQQFGKYTYVFLSKIERRLMLLSCVCQCVKCGARGRRQLA